MNEFINKQLMNKKGFTLIEVIISLTVLAVLAVMVVNEHSTFIERTLESRNNLQYTMDIYSVMEKITLDYDINMDLDLVALRNKIGDNGTTEDNPYYGNYYVINNNFYSCNATNPGDYEFKRDTTSDNSTLLVTIAAPGNKAITVSNIFSNIFSN